VDDEDLGDVIIYTGEGGRDPNTGREIADQQLLLGNPALAENHLNGIPIRVHRGKAHAADIPDGYRYRYDGLYRVARYWEERGRDDFKLEWRVRQPLDPLILRLHPLRPNNGTRSILIRSQASMVATHD
jgi:putative restriction endonuclease